MSIKKAIKQAREDLCLERGIRREWISIDTSYSDRTTYKVMMAGVDDPLAEAKSQPELEVALKALNKGMWLGRTIPDQSKEIRAEQEAAAREAEDEGDPDPNDAL